MLKTRIITALVLLAILLPALFASSPLPFALLTLVLIAAAGWEWSRLNGAPGLPAWGMGLGLAALCAASLQWLGLQAAPAWCWWLGGAIWVLGGAQALRSGPSHWPQISRGLRLGLGVLALWAAWLAMAQAKAVGINFLLSIFSLVWMADVAAYFGGRSLGRRKLAPAISPGKSWEGVWSGMVAVLLLGFLWAYVIDQRLAVDSASLYQRLLHGQGLAIGVLALLFLSAMSVVGDLFESLIKRAVGAKDSSQLLPGHGGVLDRVDALLPVFPLAMALASLGAPA
ncbi:phosphatidate cytidylyltransferase [Paucibacter sp. APW11]|uniref:Phosphatidate cytidylyltransferase n=1 Tax=Roseateles aquae TaxID=3077235 RepID=A0ABU3P8W1_9BURK|nr:phosphatidate cytidylyltransferase [Paucibacter sp. APW11]MDT8998498.1 phosphatidate cytidylyltransferase [Paucibacter sp. APW11]